MMEETRVVMKAALEKNLAVSRALSDLVQSGPTVADWEQARVNQDAPFFERIGKPEGLIIVPKFVLDHIRDVLSKDIPLTLRTI